MRVQIRSAKGRRGVALVLLAVLMPVILIVLAFVTELSKIRYVQNQLQSAADAGALAGAAKMRLTSTTLQTTRFSLDGEIGEVRPASMAVVRANTVAHLGPQRTACEVEENADNTVDGDIVLGKYTVGAGFTATTSSPNSVKVTVRFAESHPNASLPLLFSSILSRRSVDVCETATAMVERPTLLPFLVYQPQWDGLAYGGGTDRFHVDQSTGTVTAGGDGILELTVFPNDWDGLNMPPGNFGWYDLGPSSDTTTLMRQIDQGPSVDDMQYFQGDIESGDSVSGVTGLRSSTEIAFLGGTFGGITYSGIIGKPRLIALYDYATGNGTNAQFRITQFVLVRVVFVDLAGGDGVVIQQLTRGEDPHRIVLVE